jgi:hypothetical protein
MKEEQGKKISPVVSDAAVEEVIPAKPTGELSELDLDKVAGGTGSYSGVTTVLADGAVGKDVVRLNCVNEKLK